MRVSMWTSYLVEMLPEAMARTMADHGWNTCELSDEHGHDLLKLGDPATVGAEFRKKAEAMGLSFPQGHFYLCTKGIRPEDLQGRRQADIAPADDGEFESSFEDMKRWVDLFAALGIEAGVLHVGGQKLAEMGWEEERILARRVHAVRRIAEYASGGPTTICLENLGLSMGFGTFSQAAEVIDAVDMPNVAHCLDTGHAHISGQDAADYALSCGRQLKALHIADNLGTNDDHMLPYGKGTVDWARVMAALSAIGYAGLFNFEVPGDNRCPMTVRLAKLDYALELGKAMLDEMP